MMLRKHLNCRSVEGMDVRPWVSRFVCCLLAVAILSACPAVSGADDGDAGKKISKLLSSVQRKIVTQPKDAEKEWLEAKDLVGELKASDPGHKDLAKFEKKLEDLRKKLEKRLHRPIGGEGAEKPKADKGTEKPKAGADKAAEKSDLPNAVVSYLKRINTMLDAAEVGIEKFRLQTAKRKVSDATKQMKEMMSRQGKKIPEGNEEVAATQSRLEAVTAAYEKAQAEADAREAAEAEAKKKREAQSDEWLKKFAPFFDHGNDLYLRSGSDFNGGTDEEKVGYRKAYDKANALMAEYEKTEFPNGKTYTLVGEEIRLTDKLMDYNEGEKRAKQAEACKEWVDRLRSYADVGAGSDKYLVVGITLNKDDLNRRAALLEEAQGVWAEYQKAEFPLGKTLALTNLEEKMEEILKEMPESLRQSRALMSAELGKEYDGMLERLNRDTGWKSDKTKMPPIAMERDLKPLRDALKQYASTVKEDDAQLQSLKEKMEQIEKKDQENRAICAERRFMRPWKYPGSDGSDLEKKALSILKKEDPKAKSLRVTLPNEGWVEERVLEYTDTTQTAIRYRITRHMQAEVAATAEDGKVYLNCIYLANDRNSDGSWGGLYGHVMWSDWMAEENVNKKP